MSWKEIFKDENDYNEKSIQEKNFIDSHLDLLDKIKDKYEILFTNYKNEKKKLEEEMQ